MPKFIKVTYGSKWAAYLNINHIAMIKSLPPDPGGAVILMSNSPSSYYVKETAEEIMEMINGQ